MAPFRFLPRSPNVSLTGSLSVEIVPDNSSSKVSFPIEPVLPPELPRMSELARRFLPIFFPFSFIYIPIFPSFRLPKATRLVEFWCPPRGSPVSHRRIFQLLSLTPIKQVNPLLAFSGFFISNMTPLEFSYSSCIFKGLDELVRLTFSLLSYEPSLRLGT